MLYLLIGAVAALAVYSYFTDSGDSQPPPLHHDERQNRQWQAADSSWEVDAVEEAVASTSDPASLRTQADRERDLMNLYRERSRQAYSHGDHPRSKALKERVEHHRAIMKNLHAKASAAIYEENNIGRPAGEVDLHRLFVSEAIVYSEEAIKEARRRGDSEIRLIVGQGIHAEGGVPTLRPKIQRHLRDKGIPVEVDLNNPGVLIVVII